MMKKEKEQTYISTLMNMMQRLRLRFVMVVLTLSAIGLLLSSCGELNFGDMNTDPTQVTSVDPNLLFTTTELSVSGTRFEVWRANMIYSENLIQHTVCTFFSGGNNYSINQQWEHAFFNSAYDGGANGPDPAQVKNIETVLNQLHKDEKNEEKVANKLAEARILRVYIYSRITDLYGDVPYFDAGKGAIAGNYNPAYDPQKKIYTDFFKELDEAVKQFDPSQPTFESHDLIYNGDITKWKKWANSLRLRFALRLIKVDPATAKKQAIAALNASGGVMTSNDDIAFIPKEVGGGAAPVSLKQNPIAEVLAADHEFVAQAFIQWMNAHHDPRLAAYATKNPNGNYKGYPSGYINDAELQTRPDYNKKLKNDQYSRVNLSVADLTDPFFLQTYAEVEYMQAEMIVRGWTSGDAASHYSKGVTAAMKYLHLFDNGGSQPNEDIAQSAIDQYLAGNPFNTSGTTDQKLDQINTQYWAAVFLNGYEAFANWRRSGYPKLEPARVDSKQAPTGSVTGKTIPRRLLYPATTESNLNAENYKAAIDRQGPNKMTTRVWWDSGK